MRNKVENLFIQNANGFKNYQLKSNKNKKNSVELTEYTLVVDVLDYRPQSEWEDANKNVQIEKERNPSRGLMF